MTDSCTAPCLQKVAAGRTQPNVQPVEDKAAASVSREHSTFELDGMQVECSVVSSDAQAGTRGGARAIVFLSDVFGAASADNVAFTATMAADSGACVYTPDLFQGVPWREDGPPAGSPEYEEWRARVPGEHIPSRLSR